MPDQSKFAGGRFIAVAEHEMTQNGVLAATETRLVLDRQDGSLHYFMRALNGADVVDDEGHVTDLRLVGDGMNEIAAAALGSQAFPDLFLDVGFAEDPAGTARPMLRQEHLTTKFPNADAYHYDQAALLVEDPRTLEVSVSPEAAPLAQPIQALAIHIFDYLTANSDRHSGNLASVVKDGGRHLVAIQNGGCNHALIGQIADRFPVGKMDQSLLQVETVPYDLWQVQWAFNVRTAMPGRWIRAEVCSTYANDFTRMRNDAAAVLHAFQMVDHNSVQARLHARYPTLDSYDSTQLMGLMQVWSNRLQMINVDDVVTVMS